MEKAVYLFDYRHGEKVILSTKRNKQTNIKKGKYTVKGDKISKEHMNIYARWVAWW